MADPGTDASEILWHSAAHLLREGHPVVLVSWDRAADRVRQALDEHGAPADGALVLVDAHSGPFASEAADRTIDPDAGAAETKAMLEKIAEEHPGAWLVADSLSGAYDAMGGQARTWRMLMESMTHFAGTFGLFVRWPYLQTPASMTDGFDAVFELKAVEDGVIRNQAFCIKHMDWRGNWDDRPRLITAKEGAVEVVVPKIVVTGPDSAGKTTLIRTVSTEVDGTERMGTTVAMDRGRFEGDGIKAEVWGTPGQERFDALLDNLLSHATAVVLLVDSTQPSTFDRAGDLLERIRSHGVGLAVLANKQDHPDALSPDEVRTALKVPGNIPVLACKAQEERSARATVDRLLRSVLAMGVRP